jgi:FkbM family methyltransferase
MADTDNRRLLKLLSDWRASDEPPAALLSALGRNRLEVRPVKLTRAYVTTLGFAPATVFDIGVHRGTSWLYSSFPEARLVLIDPMPRPDHLDKLLGDRPHVDYLQCAAGAEKGSVTMHTPVLEGVGLRAARTAMGVPIDTQKKIAEVKSFEAEVIRLDDLVTRYPDRPYGLKIDTEGFEYGVIEGAAEFLKHCEFVIVETTVKRRFAGQKPFSAFIALMAQNGFEAMETLTDFDRHRPATDIVYVKADSPLLSNEDQDRP